jgi:glycerophosphoryl diester phosphodiesterase
MRKFLVRLFAFVIVLAGTIYLWNASWLAPVPAEPHLRLIAHRGVHQTFSREGLTNETCTAERIYPPEHNFIENTLESMSAAFNAGAEVVELDVHPTTDGRFAVMHDWTLDCRTDGTGVTRDHDLDYLKTLDIGYGYTSDGGETYPLRGAGVGLMPSLDEVFDAFPEGHFLVNYKSRDASEGDLLASILAEHPGWRNNVWGVYGGSEPTNRAVELIDGLSGFGSREMKECLIGYVLLGWTGFVPDTCRNTYVTLPINFAWLAWGWPNRFLQRMHDAGSEVILMGNHELGDAGTSGVDSVSMLDGIPADYDGYVWTNRIELIGPALNQ